MQVWSISFTDPIIAVKEVEHDRVHSKIHVTPSNTVLHKYLNPNMFAVATLSKTDTEGINKRDSFLTVDSIWK